VFASPIAAARWPKTRIVIRGDAGFCRDTRYRSRKSWSCERRFVGKAECLPNKVNSRFVVTKEPQQTPRLLHGPLSTSAKKDPDRGAGVLGGAPALHGCARVGFRG
jgi:hypothetical protein